MTNQEQPRDADAHGSGQTTGDGHRPGRTTAVLGLVPAPELPADIARQFARQLPELLANYVDDHWDWKVEVVESPLVGAVEDTARIIEQTEEYKQRHGWDYAVCITDLVICDGKDFVVADASMEKAVALISLPTFGSMGLRRRMREAILQLANELRHGSSDADRERQAQQTRKSLKVDESLRGEGARRLTGKRLFEQLFPIKRITPDKNGKTPVDVRFIARFGGNFRVLAGMVRANRPWAVFPAFKSIIAVAFATGAYGLIFPTLWKLSDAYQGPRFILLMAASMVAMVAWIIIAHRLWEPARKAVVPRIAKLYNTATVLTLSIAVVVYYVCLLGLFILAISIIVPSSLLEQKLGHPIGLSNYIVLAWLATSVATIAGAIGAGLEDEHTVRNATYGYRQRQRIQAVKETTESDY